MGARAVEGRIRRLLALFGSDLVRPSSHVSYARRLAYCRMAIIVSGIRRNTKESVKPRDEYGFFLLKSGISSGAFLVVLQTNDDYVLPL